MKKSNKKGFTIVELVIVIAVIAILSAVLIPTFGGVVNDAKESAAKTNARNEYFAYVQALDGDVADNANDFIYKDANGKFVVIKDGVIDENVYGSELDAKKAYILATENEGKADADKITTVSDTLLGSYTFAPVEGKSFTKITNPSA